MTSESGAGEAMPSSGRHTADGHVLPVRIYFEDTDFSGVVYHASYLRFMERGRTELIRALGVEQREALRAKGGTPPHVLVLTATPIPRTVAMTVFGDLEVSTIAQLPAGRQGIESFVVPLSDRPGWERRIWERASEEIAGGRQVFVVCPAISAKEAEDDGAEAPEDPVDGETGPPHPTANVESVAAQVRADPLFAQTRVGVLHGRLASDEKDAVMRAFAAGVDAMLLCNPQNPTGRCHSRRTLEALARLAARYGVFVVSDEVHAPLAHPGTRFTPFAPVARAAGARSVTVTSASKAWNGTMTS